MRKLPIVYLLSSIFFSLFLPRLALADEVCCKCKASDASNICLTITSGACKTAPADKQATNPSLKGVTCDTFPKADTKPNEGPCRTITGGGECKSISGIDAYTTAKAAPVAEPNVVEKPPQLNIPIPTLAFSPITADASGNLSIPWFAQYVSAVQRYLLGITVIAAAIMIVYGGFLYIIGSSLPKVSRGKEIIKDAIIGLILVFGAYTLLATVNPATIQLKPL